MKRPKSLSLGKVGTRIRFLEGGAHGNDLNVEGTIIDHGEGRDIVKWDDGMQASLYWRDTENRARVKVVRKGVSRSGDSGGGGEVQVRSYTRSKPSR